jgi:hypothetical protein
MGFNRIQQLADEWGVLVYALDQAKALPSPYSPAPSQWGSAASGICFGLSVIFIARRQAGRDLRHSAESKVASVDYGAIAIQNDFDATEKTDLNRAIYNGLNRLGLIADDSRNGSGATVAAANLIEAARTNGFYLFGLRGMNGAHAIVIVNEPGNVWRLFDANYGHFRMRTLAGFHAFLAWHLRESNDTGLYGADWIGVCVREPPAVTAATALTAHPRRRHAGGKHRPRGGHRCFAAVRFWPRPPAPHPCWPRRSSPAPRLRRGCAGPMSTKPTSPITPRPCGQRARSRAAPTTASTLRCSPPPPWATSRRSTRRCRWARWT